MLKTPVYKRAKQIARVKTNRRIKQHFARRLLSVVRNSVSSFKPIAEQKAATQPRERRIARK